MTANAPADDVRYVVQFTGHVQGVGFRVNAIHQARGLDVHGWVRNEPDGSVLLDAEGSKLVMEELLAKIRKSMAAKIQTADVQISSPLGRNDGFRIK